MEISTSTFWLESMPFQDIKVARPLRTKQARDVAEMIADIYKIGQLMYPKIFQCDNGSEFKGAVTKLLGKHEVKIK